MELQSLESLAKVVIPKGRKIRSNFTDKMICSVYTLALDLIDKGELGTLKKDTAEIERMLKAPTKSLENRHLNP